MDIIFSLPYLLLYLFFILLAIWDVNNRISLNSLRALECIGFLFFFGLRGYVLSDASVYYYAFQSEDNLFDWGYGFSFAEYTFEPGFRLLEKIVRAITSEYLYFQLVYSIIDFILLDIIFRKYLKNYALGFVFFAMIEGCMFEINLFRNIKSILLFIISIQFIYEKNLKKYVLLNIFGALFHMTALIYIPLYWILNKNFYKPVILVIIILGVIIPVLNIQWVHLLHLDSIIGMRYVNEVTDVTVSYNVGIRIIERVAICMMILKYYKQDSNSTIKIFYNIYVLYFFMFNIMYEIPIFPSRVAALFLPSAWFICPHMMMNKRLLPLKQSFFIVLLYGSILIMSTYSKKYAKYSNMLFGVESFSDYQDRYNSSI